MEFKEGKKFRSRSCDLDGCYFLDEYPGVRQLLQHHVVKTRDVVSWQEYETLIQYKGWTCNVKFQFQYNKGAFSVGDCHFTAICKAPEPADQMELVC